MPNRDLPLIIYGASTEDSDWIKSLPGHTQEMAIIESARELAKKAKSTSVTATIRLKGGPTSGWYGPGRGTHTGEAHLTAGSGKTGAGYEGVKKVAKPTTRFFEGSIATATMAQIYKGSSPEIQELANKTGIIALDAESERYVRGLLSDGKIENTQLAVGTKTGLMVLDGKYATDFGYTTYSEYYDRNLGWATTATQAAYMGSALAYHDLDMKNGMTKSILTGATAEELKVAHMAADIHHEVYVEYQNKAISYTEYQDRVANAVAERMTLGQQTIMGNLCGRGQLAAGLNARLKTDPKYDDDMARRWQPISVGDLPPGEIPGDFNIKGFAVNYWNQYADTPLNIKTTLPTNKMLGLYATENYTTERVKNGIENTWDYEEHAGFGLTVNGVYGVVSQRSVRTGYDKAYNAKDNETIEQYHGTGYDRAVLIASTGYKVVPDPTHGRMLGDGIYTTPISSKAAQYVGGTFGRTAGAQGVLFVNRASMGLVQEYSSSYGQLIFTDNDTIHVAKGVGGLRNEELMVRNARAVLPEFWVDATRK